MIKKRIKKAGIYLSGFLLVLLIYWLFCLPFQLFDKPPATILLDKDGQLLSASIAADEQWRIPAADSLSAKLVSAVVTFEDKRFRQHWGVDLRALARAMRQNWRAGTVVSGGSTLSMQVIRLSRNNPPRTIFQKVIEVFMATRLEWRYEKDEILKLWCDNAPFGGNVVGVEAAAWRYYGRSATDLSWAEAATLAVLPNSPGLIHPGRSREQLLAKRDKLLDKLYGQHKISQEGYELALLEGLPGAPLPLPRQATHLLERLKKTGARGRIQTSLDGNLQRRITASVERHQERLSRSEIHNAAALVLEVKTGTVVAYVGNSGSNTDHGTAVDMVTAQRSPGSLLKPVLYGLALTNGSITPQQLLPDYPSSFRGFRPANFNAGYSGAVAADRALARSLNIPFVYLLKDYGIPNFHTELKEFGFDFLNQPANHYGLSLVLGGCEISMEQIARWFLGLSRQQRFFYARQGKYAPADWSKTLLLREPEIMNSEVLRDQAEQIDAGAGYLLLQALRQLERPGEVGDWEQFSTSRNIAWKTGTSFGFRDAWAVGTDPNYVVAVWAGNADGEGRKGLVGVKAAAPLFFEIFRGLPRREPNWFEAPYDELRQQAVCNKSGQPASQHCPVDTNWVNVNSERAGICTYHQPILVDITEKYRVLLDCTPTQTKAVKWFELPTKMAHYYRREHPDYQTIPPWHPNCSKETQAIDKGVVMDLIYPHGTGTITLSVDENNEPIPVIFKLAHRYPTTEVHWHLDGDYLTTTTQFHNCEIIAPPGRHQLALTDAQGRTLQHYFTISQ